MNISDTLAESYIQQFWPEKPEPMKQMIRMAYTAGYNGFRGQVAAMTMQPLLVERCFYADNSELAKTAVRVADALIAELNKKR